MSESVTIIALTLNEERAMCQQGSASFAPDYNVLRAASGEGHEEVVKMLLDAGADLTV